MQVTETADAAAATSTAYSMAVGDYFFGTLDTALDSDWIRIDLTAGQTYTFGLVGVGALTDNLDDSYLRVRNSTGTQIAFDDDGGPGRNSSITFTATTTDTYYLDVQSWNNSEAGDYGLSATLGTKASYDVTMGAGVLLRPDASWAATPGTGVTVTWGIRATGPATDALGDPAPFAQLSAAQAAAAQSVLAMFDGLSGLTLTQVNPGGSTDAATILIGAYTSTADGAGAYAYYPGSTASSAASGDVWLNNNSISQTSLPPGSYSSFALMHEVGHAVGLAHPGDYNAAPGETITYATKAQFIEDSHQYTLMSYFDESNTTSNFSSYPDTLLLYDIYALHQLYGADVTFHAGNTTYGFNATVGGAYDFTTNADPVLSIWDGSGIDTLDLSGYAMAQIIDLREGRFSNVGGFQANVSIAMGAVIENAVGGSGDDLITGNGAANVLVGGDGADTLIGGAGADTMHGQLGNDTVSYAGSATAVGARLDGLAGWGGAAGDVIYTVENLIGSAKNDTLVGSAGANLLQGGDGNDTLWALEGNDTLIGGAGADTMHGQLGNDTVSYAGSATAVGARLDGLAGWGGAAGDVIYMVENLIGSAKNDTLVGSAGANLLQGGDGNDTLWALEGNDTLIGGAGADTMHGQLGNDTVSYAGSATAVGARLDGLAGWGGAAGDVIYTVENLIGSAKNDTLVGSAGANLLQGGDGNDTLWALEGNDTLIGGAGADTMYGQGGNDTFIFADGFGVDSIMDFQATNDLEKIDLSAVSSITNWADLSNPASGHLTQIGLNVVIDDLSGNTVVLMNVNLSDLHEADFIF